MNIVIIEDEPLAAEKLKRYLLKYNSKANVLAILPSIQEAVDWFNSNVDYDVIFMDIQLSDGLSFEIFSQVSITKPVIFTTAFDEYAIDAFKFHSVDYLLKPITFTDVSSALKKLTNMKQVFAPETYTALTKKLSSKKVKYRFLVKLGNHIHSIKTEEVALFYAEGRTVYLVTKQNKKFIVDFKLEDINELLDQTVFFRVNRSFIVNINAITDVIVYSNSRLKISPTVTSEKEIIVSREKVSSFKNWFEGN